MADEEQQLPLSALQHWAYCPRQCALIHLDQVFDDNLHTLRGQAVHARTDQAGMELRKDLRIERALPLWHDDLGLIGKADVVEFDASGRPYPVEYKQGSRHKAADIAACDDLQLAAQALCLEAMSGHAVPEGAIYYARSKRRRVVPITAALREQVAHASRAVRELLRAERLPLPLQGDAATQRCGGCSLKDRCLPEAAHRRPSPLFDPDAEL